MSVINEFHGKHEIKLPAALEDNLTAESEGDPVRYAALVDRERKRSVGIMELSPHDRGLHLAKVTGHAGGDNILCLGRLGFNDDVIALRAAAPGLQWPTLPAEYLSKVHGDLVPTGLQTQGNAYWDKETLEMATALLEALQPKAVLSANINYWPEASLRAACARLGIPFVVLCREHWCIPCDLDVWRGSTPAADVAAVCVAGESSRDALTRYGTVAPERVHVTGLPRWDAWRDMPAVERDLVVLLEYADEAYLAPQNYREVLKVFHGAAWHHGQDQFVIRTKADHTQPLPELLNRARLVIGFNSLSLIDALLSPAEVAVPHWGDARRGLCELMLWPGASAVRFPLSPPDLRTMIDEAMHRKYSQPQRFDAVRSLVAWDDVPATEKVLTVLGLAP